MGMQTRPWAHFGFQSARSVLASINIFDFDHKISKGFFYFQNRLELIAYFSIFKK